MSSGRRSRTLAGRYRLDEVIGRGGMSTVYRGTDLALDRVVAVKVALDPLAEENPVYVARFKREARAAAAINDPGVVTVYDAGADGPTRYIVMEYVEGQSLSAVLRDRGPENPLDPVRAARIAEQIADTLSAAHAVGVVHRDIKPANVMITPEDRVKVLDFGIARTADAVTLTQTASVLGTAPYMAPEQAMGNPADARSDIYSLGCVLYEMLTGRPPFMADLPAAVLHQQVRVAPKPPSERNPAVPPALDALVMEMLAKRPEDRPQTAAEVRDRLASFVAGDATAPTRPIAPVDVLAAAATVAQPPPDPSNATAATRALPPPTPSAPRSRRGLWAALAAICVVLLGGAVAYAVAGSGSSHSTSTPSHSSATTGSSHRATTSTPRTTNSSTPSTTTVTTTTTKSSTSTGTTSSTPTTTVTTSTTPPATTGPLANPGSGGTPPGQAKQTTTK